MAGVVWLAGLPCVGKTTIGDELRSLIQSSTNTSAIRLDGDVLRVVIDKTNVADSSERLNLLYSYLKLSWSLALQGHTVIVSAVSLDPIFFQIFEDLNVPKCFVLLTAPDQVRVNRDSRGVLDSARQITLDYDFEYLHSKLPQNSIVQSTENKSPKASAVEIFEQIKDIHGLFKEPIELMNTENVLRTITASRSAINQHWNLHYAKQQNSRITQRPSDFSQIVVNKLSQISKNIRILDLGCGDGRDTFFFGQKFECIGLDTSQSAITFCRNQQTNNGNKNLKFDLVVNLEDVGKYFELDRTNVVYMRFFIHAIPGAEEEIIWRTLSQAPTGTVIFIETRTYRDLFSSKGVSLSTEERIFGHYRRFTDPLRLRNQLEDSGYEIDSWNESDGLSKIEEDNPVLLRVSAIKT
jgi:tellurite methyltransferase